MKYYRLTLINEDSHLHKIMEVLGTGKKTINEVLKHFVVKERKSARRAFHRGVQEYGCIKILGFDDRNNRPYLYERIIHEIPEIKTMSKYFYNK